MSDSSETQAKLHAELNDIEQMFAELTAAVGMDMRDELLALFFPTLDECVAGLAVAIPAGDVTAIVSYAHKLKGASAQLGASRLAAYSKEVESAAKQADLNEAASQFIHARSLAEALIKALRV